MWIDALGRGLFLTFYLLYLTKAAGFSLEHGRRGSLARDSGLALAATPIAGSLVDQLWRPPDDAGCQPGHLRRRLWRPAFRQGSVPLLLSPPA